MCSDKKTEDKIIGSIVIQASAVCLYINIYTVYTATKVIRNLETLNYAERKCEHVEQIVG